MADFDHTLESSSAQEKPSYNTNLIVQTVCASTPPGIGSLAHSVISSQYNPYIVLQGKWLRKLGFEIGDPIRVVAEPSLLCVIPSTSYIEANTMVGIVPGRPVSHVDFMEEVDGIKAERIGMNRGQDHNTDDGKKDGGKYGNKDSGKGCDQEIGNNSAKNEVADGAMSEDASDVLTGVKSELDYD